VVQSHGVEAVDLPAEGRAEPLECADQVLGLGGEEQAAETLNGVPPATDEEPVQA